MFKLWGPGRERWRGDVRHAHNLITVPDSCLSLSLLSLWMWLSDPATARRRRRGGPPGRPRWSRRAPRATPPAGRTLSPCPPPAGRGRCTGRRTRSGRSKSHPGKIVLRREKLLFFFSHIFSICYIYTRLLYKKNSKQLKNCAILSIIHHCYYLVSALASAWVASEPLKFFKVQHQVVPISSWHSCRYVVVR